MAGLISKPNKTSIAVTGGENPIRGLQNDVNRLFNDFFGDFNLPNLDRLLAPVPAVDISTTDQAYTIVAETPGMDAQDIHVTVADGYVTIKGDKTRETKSEDRNYVRRERTFGSFQRVIDLPKDADMENVTAELQNGVLTLHVKRQGQDVSQARTINIREVA